MRPSVRRERGPRFPFPIPNGWFIVAPSGAVGVGEILPVYYFAKDLIVFRTASGAARVTSAYCAHLGAHIGVGGKVNGDSVECPFHGWCYDGQSGRCSNIPYGLGCRSHPEQGGDPRLSRPGAERHDLGVAPPRRRRPVLRSSRGARALRSRLERALHGGVHVRTVCQEMAENNHDPAHFQFVHGTDDIPQQDVFIDGGYKRVVGMDGHFVRETFGLGLGVLRMTDVMTFLTSTTPIDEESVHVRWTFLAPKTSGPDAAKGIAESFLGGVSQDIPIWENKRYVERPVVIKDERSILDHREWCKQFYSDPAKAID